MVGGGQMRITEKVLSRLDCRIKGRTHTRQPLMLSVFVNSVCNARCVMCDIGNGGGNFTRNIASREEMTFDVFAKIVDQYTGNIAINGTEPLLHPEITRMVKYATRRGVHCTLTTNGLMLPKHAQGLINAKPSELIVSIDGPKEIHDKTRGVDGIYDAAVEGIRMVANHIDVAVAMTVTDKNYPHIEDTGLFFKTIGVKRFIVSHLNFITRRMADAHNEQFGDVFGVVKPSSEMVDPTAVNTEILREQINEFNEYLACVPELNGRQYERYYKTERPVVYHGCVSAWKHMQILANGDVIPASRCFNMKLGNIHTETIEEIWTGCMFDKFRSLIKKHGVTPACERCCARFAK